MNGEERQQMTDEREMYEAMLKNDPAWIKFLDDLDKDRIEEMEADNEQRQ